MREAACGVIADFEEPPDFPDPPLPEPELPFPMRFSFSAHDKQTTHLLTLSIISEILWGKQGVRGLFLRHSNDWERFATRWKQWSGIEDVAFIWHRRW